MKKIKQIALIIFFNLCLTSFGGTIDPFINDEKYVDFAKNFNYVYQICGEYENKEIYCASAVAIDAHWILTAAHVVNNAKICIVHKNDKAYLSQKIIIHPEYQENKFGKCDIAMCYIDENLELNFYPELYEDSDEIGKICTISGYGLTGNFNTGCDTSDEKQRAGTNKIDSIEQDLLICSPSITNKTPLEFLICHGDSGGGLFIGSKLAGIHSCVMAKDKNPNSTYNDESGHTRISKFVTWIKKNMLTEKPDIKSVLKDN